VSGFVKSRFWAPGMVASWAEIVGVSKRERGELGGSGEFGPRIDKMCVTPAAKYSPSSGMPQMVMRGAVRLVLFGSLSRRQARQKFSRIKAGGDTANGRHRIESCRSAGTNC
jgi:hypothetical protein